MVQDLILRTGPALIARRPAPDHEQQGRPLRDVDVTDRAHEVLFEPVILDAAVTLGDVIRLMDASPLLQQVFRRDFAAELCAEARKGPVAKAGADPGSHEAIEVLELYQEWRVDSSTNSYSSIQRLQLHGVGPALTQDAPEHGRKKGERIQWSVSLEPLRQLLALPLRVNPEVQLIEDDIDAKAYGMEITRARHPDVTLGEIIHSLLWELSFHGGPEEQAAMRDELKSRVTELEDGTVEAIPADDIFGELDRPGCDALFDDLGGRSAREIGIALRDIDYDDCLVTDESRLSDFASCGLPDEIADATVGLKKLYAAWDAWVTLVICERYKLVNVTPTVLLVDLFERIEQRRLTHLH